MTGPDRGSDELFQAWFWTPAWQAGEALAGADIAAGRLEVFGTDEDFLASLDD